MFEEAGEWHQIQVREPGGTPNLRKLLVVPLAGQVGEVPAHAVEGPVGPPGGGPLCALRLTIWRDMVKQE
eukprot:5965691-Alexandrium_andersonii.AAC.1